MVKGETFSQQLFENEAFRHFINTFLNKESGITQGCELTQTSSSITVGTGYFVILGGFLREKTGTTLSLPTDAGYYKLVYEIDLTKTNTKTDFNQGNYKFVRSLGDYPSLIQEDLDNGGTLYQFEFCQFIITEGGITDYLDKRTFLDFDNIYEEIRATIEGIKDTSDIAFKNWVEGTTLYESETGLNSKNPIPLTDTASNYKRIKIYYKNDAENSQIWNTAELFDAVGKKFTLETMRQGSVNTYKDTAEIIVAENQINWGNFGQFTINGNGISDYHVNYQGFIRVYKIVGYKY